MQFQVQSEKAEKVKKASKSSLWRIAKSVKREKRTDLTVIFGLLEMSKRGPAQGSREQLAADLFISAQTLERSLRRLRLLGVIRPISRHCYEIVISDEVQS